MCVSNGKNIRHFDTTILKQVHCSSYLSMCFSPQICECKICLKCEGTGYMSMIDHTTLLWPIMYSQAWGHCEHW